MKNSPSCPGGKIVQTVDLSFIFYWGGGQNENNDKTKIF